MKITTHHSLAEIDFEQWQQLSATSSVANFFQTVACFQFYTSLSFLQPFLFGVSENEQLKGVVCGYIVADGGRLGRFFSRRAIVPGGALLADDISDEAVQKLFTLLTKNLNKQVIYIEIRNYANYEIFRKAIENASFQYRQHFDIQIDIADEQRLWSNIQTTKQRQIRKSELVGAVYEETTALTDVAAFYAILKHTYKTRVNRPLFPLSFFEKLVASSFGKLLVIKYKGRIVGGMACVEWQQKALYEWFVCGVETENIYTSAMATWAGLQYAAQKHLPLFDFMGAGQPNVPYGVRDFKMKFGGNLLEFGRFLHVCNPFLYKIGCLAVRLFKWLP